MLACMMAVYDDILDIDTIHTGSLSFHLNVTEFGRNTPLGWNFDLVSMLNNVLGVLVYYID